MINITQVKRAQLILHLAKQELSAIVKDFYEKNPTIVRCFNNETAFIQSITEPIEAVFTSANLEIAVRFIKHKEQWAYTISCPTLGIVDMTPPDEKSIKKNITVLLLGPKNLQFKRLIEFE